MSRIANSPVSIPAGVTISAADNLVTVKGKKESLTCHYPETVDVNIEESEVTVQAHNDANVKFAGTVRSLINNMVIGVSEGFEKKLKLVGVGFRATIQGKKLNLVLGFSHPVDFDIPEGIVIEAPSATDVVIKGADKQLVGQVAANIRALRPPEPYKGKGVRYADERIIMKEAKKA